MSKSIVSDATKAMVVYQSHCDMVASTILQDDGWSGEMSAEIFEAFSSEDYETASSLLKSNGWKAENFY